MKPTWKDIEKLALEDPIIRACVDAHRYVQGMSREDALMLMVWHLHDAKKALLAMRIEQMKLSPVPLVITQPEPTT